MIKTVPLLNDRQAEKLNNVDLRKFLQPLQNYHVKENLRKMKEKCQKRRNKSISIRQIFFVSDISEFTLLGREAFVSVFLQLEKSGLLY